jgi:hypothetical protein
VFEDSSKDFVYFSVANDIARFSPGIVVSIEDNESEEAHSSKIDHDDSVSRILIASDMADDCRWRHCVQGF